MNEMGNMDWILCFHIWQFSCDCKFYPRNGGWWCIYSFKSSTWIRIKRGEKVWIFGHCNLRTRKNGQSVKSQAIILKEVIQKIENLKTYSARLSEILPKNVDIDFFLILMKWKPLKLKRCFLHSIDNCRSWEEF